MAKKKELVDSSLFQSATDILTEEKENISYVPIGPALDSKLGGGIPEGSLVLIRTLAKVGKSTLAMQIVSNALAQGRYVIYADIECRLSGFKYFQIRGFDFYNPKFLILRSKSGEPLLSGDKIYKTIKDMMSLPKYKGALYVIDSFSKVIPEDTLNDTDIKASRRDTTPKLNADFCKKVGNLVRTTNSIVVGIQHFITNTSGYGDPLVPDGGVKLEYESDIVIEARHKPFNWDGERLNDDDGKELKGQLMKLQVPYNKKLAPYVSKKKPVHCYLKFGEGVWWAREALDILPETGMMAIKGAWYNFILPDGTEFKANGAEKAVVLIEEHREVFEKVIKDYFIEKYKVSYDFKPPVIEETEE